MEFLSVSDFDVDLFWCQGAEFYIFSVLIDEKIDIKIAVPIPQLDLGVSITGYPKIPAVYVRSRSMMAEQMTLLSTSLADVIIKPKVDGIKMADWSQVNKIIEAGEIAAETAINRIQYLLMAHANQNLGR